MSRGHAREARRRGAEMVPDLGVEQVAARHGVTAATVRRWCREFPAGGGSNSQARGVSLASALLPAQRATLRQLSLGYAPEKFRIRGEQKPQIFFAPRSFSDTLALIAQQHRSSETPDAAFDGLVSAVSAVRAVTDHPSTPKDRLFGGHVERLERIVGICATKAAGSGPLRGLRLFNDTLAEWGRCGIDPDRLLGVPATRFDELRPKVEQAAEHLVAALEDLPTRFKGFSDNSAPVCWVRAPGEVRVGADFGGAFDMFAPPECEDPEDEWPRLSPEGHELLTKAATTSADAAGLRVGVDISIHPMAIGKGCVTVVLKIPDKQATGDHRAANADSG